MFKEWLRGSGISDHATVPPLLKQKRISLLTDATSPLNRYVPPTGKTHNSKVLASSASRGGRSFIFVLPLEASVEWDGPDYLSAAKSGGIFPASPPNQPNEPKIP